MAHVDVFEDGNTILKLEGASEKMKFFHGQVVTGFLHGTEGIFECFQK